MTRYFNVDARFKNIRINRVGIFGSTLILQPIFKDVIQFWSVDSMFPSNWTQLCEIPLKTVIYSVASCAYDEPIIYCFCYGTEDPDDRLTCSLFKYNMASNELKRFDVRVDEQQEHTAIALETLSLRCDANNVVLFDRSIVKGAIPYWRIRFVADDAFNIVNEYVKDLDDDQPSHCKRYPIPFDAVNRVFGRLKDERSMMVFRDGEWNEYIIDDGEMFRFPTSMERGVRETYGRNGHRVGAVESPLTFHCDANVCIARIVKNDRHFFYRITLDHETRTIRCSERGNTKLLERVDKMFYSLCTDNIFAFVGIQSIAIVSLQPPRLRDVAVWRLQKHYANDKQCLESALTEADIHKLCYNLFQVLNSTK
ncbi:unnamed protein product [Caenorhabditis bovis]|uniref:Uncharacterized protein n=1 Tax=Caenorhabditis bovis TaxID=2654633 RepID=A0A8S1EV07_9PELO|nr:unnamed protein product [Caenorhabditis bovis]